MSMVAELKECVCAMQVVMIFWPNHFKCDLYEACILFKRSFKLSAAEIKRAKVIRNEHCTALEAVTIAAAAVPAKAIESKEQSDKSLLSNLPTELLYIVATFEGIKKDQQHIKNI